MIQEGAPSAPTASVRASRLPLPLSPSSRWFIVYMYPAKRSKAMRIHKATKKNHPRFLRACRATGNKLISPLHSRIRLYRPRTTCLWVLCNGDFFGFTEQRSTEDPR
uniref:Uncharacterized protein n=1 Tax=Treubia lacunosa TaxID=93845 RepID=G4Y9U1_9MARC|nr:hypothetical protein TrlaMp42 [Treubia lacunosa]AEH99737.1 hypothetical protein TrlaMp42 [Treubia lacunosa]